MPHAAGGPFISDRYEDLAPDSSLLRRINQELDLPHDVMYTSVVIQGTGSSLTDSGHAYERYVRLPKPELEALPDLMCQGHDGAVHCLSAQLHLTPTGARYENMTDRPIHVVVCTLKQSHGDHAKDLTLHTWAMRDETLWETLRRLLEDSNPGSHLLAHAAAEQTRDRWARQIAVHETERRVQRRHLTGHIRDSEITRWEASVAGAASSRYLWQCECRIDVRYPFRGVECKAYTVAGSFELRFDRFDRPIRAVEPIAEVVESQAERLRQNSVHARGAEA